MTESTFYPRFLVTPESWVDLLRCLGRERNDRAFGPIGLEPLTKKASRQDREVCGKNCGSMVLKWEHGSTMAYMWRRERTQVRIKN